MTRLRIAASLLSSCVLIACFVTQRLDTKQSFATLLSGQRAKVIESPADADPEFEELSDRDSCRAQKRRHLPSLPSSEQMLRHSYDYMIDASSFEGRIEISVCSRVLNCVISECLVKTCSIQLALTPRQGVYKVLNFSDTIP